MKQNEWEENVLADCDFRRSYQDIKNLAPEKIRTWQDLTNGYIEEPCHAEQENEDDYRFAGSGANGNKIAGREK